MENHVCTGKTICEHGCECTRLALSVCYMAKKSSESDRPSVSAELPTELLEQFGRAVDDSGLKKKHAIAAALYGFMVTDGTIRWEWWQQANRQFSVSGQPGESSPTAKIFGRGAKAALERGRAKDTVAAKKARGGAAG